MIERFVLLPTYSRTSDVSRVINARKHPVAEKYCSVENIPPTDAALEYHLKRAVTTTNCWNMCISAHPYCQILLTGDGQRYWPTRVAAILAWASLQRQQSRATNWSIVVVRSNVIGAAIQCTSPCFCSEDCHAAPQTECATFNDCNTMFITLERLHFWHHFELFLTVFGGDNNYTYVLFYTHIIFDVGLQK